MSVAKPPKLPIWDENATNIVEPQSTNQSDGWQVDANGIPQKPPFQYHNYMWHTQYKWFEYLDAEKALLQGDSTKTFKVADAVKANEALSKGQLLTAIKEVDGADSGIDAELLSGLESTKFLRRDTDNMLSGKYNFINNSDVSLSSDGAITIGDVSYVNMSFDNNEIQARKNGDASTLMLNASGGNVSINNATAWHARNDGKNSGLDADLVRGLPADFTSSKATNGYQKLPGGLIIQWGESKSRSSNDITFPIAFPNACLNATCTNGRNTDSNSDYFAVNMSSYTTTKFSTQHYDSAVDLSWMAIGY